MRALLLVGVAGLLLAAIGPAMAIRQPADRAVIDDHGVLRWKDTGSEVALFGVNYYPPFSINYHDLKEIGADPEQTIRDDVAHFVRLGLDEIRLHVWDREISDAEGNLTPNVHLQLLDYLLSECKRNGIYAVLTPIAWWPAPNPSAGFSNLYSMEQMTTDLKARAAEERYLTQFMQHRNSYTGLTYGTDPEIVGFELINEPHYPPGTTDDQVLAYIDALAGAIRKTGCEKPIFYNGWEGHHGAVARSIIQGCTFSWYPTGLVSGHELTANFLPRVQDFPSMRDPLLQGKVKGVYEFDTADVGTGYLYPALARSFRAGGAQFATQFQYDCLPLASSNADWQTHYLNLVYTPQKAIGFLIAGDAFHNLPRLRQYGDYPASNRFGEYRVSYRQALSERVGKTAFLYCNNTTSKPPAPADLNRIAGCGSSPVVSYSGTGAYFLDRLSPGLWRLEVYPDCVWTRDPFGPTQVGREVARVYWRDWPMQVSLPDLGADFSVTAETDSTGHALTTTRSTGLGAKDGRFEVNPGVYLLRRMGCQATPAPMDHPFVAPPDRSDLPPAAWYDSPAVALAGKALPVDVTVAAPGDPAVTLHYQSRGDGPWKSMGLRQVSAYHYAGYIPAGDVKEGAVRYRITVDALQKGVGRRVLSFPGGMTEAQIAAGQKARPFQLFAAGPKTAVPALSVSGAPGQTAHSVLARLADNHWAVRLAATGFGPPPSCAGLRMPATAPGDASPYDTLVVRARALDGATTAVEIGLVQNDGTCFGYDAPLGKEWNDIRIPVSSLQRLWDSKAARPDLTRLKEISIMFGSWLFPGSAGLPHGLEVESVRLTSEPAVWRVEVNAPGAPIPLVAPGTHITLQGLEGATQSVVAGKDGDAVRVAAPGFGPPPSCVSFRVDLQDVLVPWQGELDQRTTLHLLARAGEPSTTAVELVMLENDGSPWGVNVPLTTQWQDVRIPLVDLKFWPGWPHPTNRGGPGDHLHAGRLQAVNVCFGAWLFPEKAADPHSVEIEGIWLE